MHTVRLAQAALPLPGGERPTGSIVAISSVSGREADFAAGPYGTMKTAIVGYISGPGVPAGRARASGPTWSRRATPTSRAGSGSRSSRGTRTCTPIALGLNPTGRMGTPEDIARAVVFLSSPVSSFTTGTHLVVDGALTRGIQL